MASQSPLDRLKTARVQPGWFIRAWGRHRRGLRWAY